MNLIPNDIARCVGRMVSLSIGTVDPICPRRDQCARYRQIEIDRDRFADGYPEFVSVATGLCRDGGDFMIQMERVA